MVSALMRSIAVNFDQPADETPVSIERFPDDLRSRLDWRRLLQLVLDAVLAQPLDSAPQSTRPAVLLTLVTYCYAVRLLGSRDIEDATKDRPEVAYITRGMAITAADIRRFRRTHRAQIENCLARVWISGASELAAECYCDKQAATPLEAAVMARNWVAGAVLFDTAFSE